MSTPMSTLPPSTLFHHMVQAPRCDDCTALHCVGRAGRCRALRAILYFYGGDATHCLRARADGHTTPIHDAATYGHLDALQLMLHFDPEGITAIDDREWTPLHYAIYELGMSEKYYPVVEYIMRAFPFTIVHPDSESMTPMHVLADVNDEHRLQLFQLALTLRPDGIPRQDVWLRTPLHYLVRLPGSSFGDLARQERVKAVRGIFQLQPTAPQQRDMNGNLPLHWAAEAGNEEMVKELVEMYPDGASVGNDEAMTPVDLARRGRYRSVVALLERVRRKRDRSPEAPCGEDGKRSRIH